MWKSCNLTNSSLLGYRPYFKRILWEFTLLKGNFKRSCLWNQLAVEVMKASLFDICLSFKKSHKQTVVLLTDTDADVLYIWNTAQLCSLVLACI